MSTPEIATLVQLQEAETEIVRLKGVLEKVEKVLDFYRKWYILTSENWY